MEKKMIDTLFTKGHLIEGSEGKNFAGNAYLERLVAKEDDYDLTIANVTFEPGCINNWHTHPGGQILLVTEGRGWYQEEGKDPVELTPGMVIKVPADVRHWHGAAKDAWLGHIAISPEIHKGPANWQEPVTHYEDI